MCQLWHPMGGCRLPFQRQWRRHLGICHSLLTPWARAGDSQLGEPRTCDPKCPSLTNVPCASHFSWHMPTLPCVLMCMCVHVPVGRTWWGGPGMGHPAAGEAPSTVLGQGVWPMVPAPRAAVLLWLGTVHGQWLGPLLYWGHQSQAGH